MRAKHWLVGAAMSAAAGGAAQAQVSSATATTELPTPTVELLIEVTGADAAIRIEPAVADGAAEPVDPDWPFGAAVVGLGDLETMSGGQAVVVAISNHELEAINRNNTINADTVGSGDVSIGASAFDGFNGIGNFVINTGHNNNLQGSLSVNVVLSQ